MKKSYHIPAVITILFFAVTAIAAVLPAKEEPSHFKNLKVLPKDISEEALDKIMDNFNYALGVKCNFCHVRKEDGTKHLNFESDAKSEKEIARNMMRMTADLNKRYFNFSKKKIVPQTVTCITCHRKNSIPDTDSLPERKKGGN